jgi:hypothetical protein
LAEILNRIIQGNLPVTEPQGTEVFSIAGKFRLIRVLDGWILGIPDSRNWKSSSLKTAGVHPTGGGGGLQPQI